MIRHLSLLILALGLSACSIVDPLVYKLPKQQGNITDYKELEKLELGMNKAQVRFIMGTPMEINSFNKDRWDYVYTFKSPKGEYTRNKLMLMFTDGKLAKIEGTPLIKKDEKDTTTGQS
jgi:outer membrane protein assembly factor BamE